MKTSHGFKVVVALTSYNTVLLQKSTVARADNFFFYFMTSESHVPCSEKRD